MKKGVIRRGKRELLEEEKGEIKSNNMVRKMREKGLRRRKSKREL
jgi:hypothetical protein